MKIIKKEVQKQPVIAFVANTAWFIFNFRMGIIKKLQILGYHIVVITPKDANYSMELPIITTDNQGCRDIGEDGFNGFLVQPKNVADLATKMEQMFLSSREVQTKMGKNGRLKVINTFEENLVFPYYLNYLKKFKICPSYF